MCARVNWICVVAAFLWLVAGAGCSAASDEVGGSDASPDAGAPSQPDASTPDATDDESEPSGLVLHQCPVEDEPPLPAGGGCAKVEGDLRVSSMDDLAPFADAYCVEVGGSVIIEGTDAVDFPDDAPSIKKIDGSLVIRNNTALEQVPVDLEEGAVLGEIVVQNNPSLVDLSVGDLKRVHGDLVLRDNLMLDGFEAPALEQVGGAFEVRENARLARLWVPPLRTVGASLIVEDNPVLEELRLNVPFVDQVGGDLRVARNASLAACRVDRLISLVDPAAVSGQVAASGNDQAASCAPGCMWSGTFYVSKPHDLDVFDELGCSSTIGGLVIKESSLTNLDGLESLRELGGPVEIVDNPHLRNIAGLRNLEKSPLITVRGNASLETLDAFGRIKPSAFRSYRIQDNPALRDLRGFRGKSSVGILNIENNDALTTLSDLSALEEALVLQIAGNDSLVDLRGLEGLQRSQGHCSAATMAGYIRIENNDALESLDGLDNLRSVTGDLSVLANPSLEDVSALSGLRSVGECGNGGIEFTDNDRLRSLAPLGVESARSVEIRGNAALVDLRGLEKIESAKWVIIEGNDTLTSLEGLDSLKGVGRESTSPQRPVDGGLWVVGNDNLTSLAGLDSFGGEQTNTGDIYIEENPSLTDLSGLEDVWMTGRIQVARNDRMTSLDGLDNLHDARDIIVEGNAMLESIDELRRLESTFRFHVRANPSLDSCSARDVAAAIGRENIDRIEIRCNENVRICSEDVPGPPEIAHCGGEPDVSVGSLGGPVEQYAGSAAPNVDGDSIYFHQKVGEHTQVFRHDVTTGQTEQVSDVAADMRLQEASGGRFVAVNRTYPPGRALDVRDRDGALIGTVADTGVESLVVGGRYSGAPAYGFDGERLLSKWRKLNLWGADGDKIGSAGEPNSFENLGASRPVLTPTGFAFAAAEYEWGPEGEYVGSPAELFLFDPYFGRRQLTKTPRNERHVYADGAVLYWVDDEGVYRSAAARSVERIHQGRCGPPHASAGMAAFACASEEDPEDSFPTIKTSHHGVSELFWYDGSTTRQIELAGDPALVHSPRITRQGIAWFEFDEANALCEGDTKGRVMYYDFATERQVELGQVNAPCLCCEEFAPQLVLSVGEGVVAWNQAGSLPDNTWLTSGYAYARIERPERCDR